MPPGSKHSEMASHQGLAFQSLARGGLVSRTAASTHDCSETEAQNRCCIWNHIVRDIIRRMSRTCLGRLVLESLVPLGTCSQFVVVISRFAHSSSSTVHTCQCCRVCVNQKIPKIHSKRLCVRLNKKSCNLSFLVKAHRLTLPAPGSLFSRALSTARAATPRLTKPQGHRVGVS